MEPTDATKPSMAKPGLVEVFGWKLLFMIFLTHHALAGINGNLVYHAMEFTFRELQVAGPSMQVLSTVAFLPYSMKALMGLVSDGFPLFGLRKGPYIVIATLCALTAYVFLITTERPQLQTATAAFFTIFFHIALSDLLVQAKAFERIRAFPERGPELQSLLSGGMSVLHIFSSLCGGALLQHHGPRVCYAASFPVAALMLWPAACNYLEEQRPESAPVCSPDASVWKGRGFIPFLLALVSGLSAITLLFSALLVSSVQVNFAVALSLCVLNVTLLSVFLRPLIAKINAFCFLHSIFHIGTHGAAFYFFTDTEAQYHNGPHLSNQFYVTGMGTMASVASLVGVLLYSCFKTTRFRCILMSTSVVASLVNCLSVIAYKRINVELGFSDKPFLLASSAMQTVLGQLAWMPIAVMLAQLVPKGIESVMMALLSASLSSGSRAANFGGALVLQQLGVTPNGSENEDAKFDNLWIAGLVSACGPLIPLILVNFLIPAGRQTDKLPVGASDLGSATSGSLFEQYFAGSQCMVEEDSLTVALTSEKGAEMAFVQDKVSHKLISGTEVAG